MLRIIGDQNMMHKLKIWNTILKLRFDMKQIVVYH